MGKSKACKISNILLLELEKDMEERKEALLFSLYFLLETRVRVTSSASGISTAISILGKNVGTESGPQIVFITSIWVELSDRDKTLKQSYPALEIIWKKF